MTIEEQQAKQIEELSEALGTDFARFKEIMHRAKNIVVVVECEDAVFIETNAPNPIVALELLVGVTEFLMGEVHGAIGRQEPEGDIDSESGGSDPLDKGTIN